jgi:hypothetical protein
MPVDQNNYDNRGGDNLGIVVRCLNIVGNRLVYFDHNRWSGGWVIRDFLLGLRLDNQHSVLAVQEIEADADYDEFPPWLNVGHEAREWHDYLKTRTNAVLKLRNDPISKSPPNPASGTWRKLP